MIQVRTIERDGKRVIASIHIGVKQPIQGDGFAFGVHGGVHPCTIEREVKVARGEKVCVHTSMVGHGDQNHCLGVPQL